MSSSKRPHSDDEDEPAPAPVSTTQGSRGGIRSLPTGPAANVGRSAPPAAAGSGGDPYMSVDSRTGYPKAVGDDSSLAAAAIVAVGLGPSANSGFGDDDDPTGSGLALAVENAGCCSVPLIRFAAPGWTARLRTSARDEQSRGVSVGPRVSISALHPNAGFPDANGAENGMNGSPDRGGGTVTRASYDPATEAVAPAHRLSFAGALKASVPLVFSLVFWSLLSSVITIGWLAAMWAVYFQHTVSSGGDGSNTHDFVHVELDTTAQKWWYALYLCAQSGVALCIPYATLNAFLGYKRTRKISWIAIGLAGVVFPLFLCIIQAVGQFKPQVWIAPFQFGLFMQVIVFGWSVSTHWHSDLLNDNKNSAALISDLDGSLSPAPGAAGGGLAGANGSAPLSGSAAAAGGGFRRARCCECSWPRVRTTLSIVVPQYVSLRPWPFAAANCGGVQLFKGFLSRWWCRIVGQGVPILFITVGFDFYSDTPTHLQPYILGLVLPLATVGVHILARLFAYRLMGRISEAAASNDDDDLMALAGVGGGAARGALLRRDDIPVVNNAADAWVLSYLLTFLLSLAGRVMVCSVSITRASFQDGLWYQSVACLVLGASELLSLSTIECRDAIGHRVLWCHQPIPTSSYFFSDRDKIKFLSDTNLAQCLSTYIAIGVANTYLLITEVVHGFTTTSSDGTEQLSFGVLVAHALARTAVQLVIAIVIDIIGCAIQMKLAFPLVDVWKQRWHGSVSRRRRWLRFIVLVAVAGGTYFSTFAVSLLRRQARAARS